jgi:hypothetical protein
MTQVIALLCGKAVAPLSDDIGELGLDFLGLLVSEVRRCLLIARRMMGSGKEFRR